MIALFKNPEIILFSALAPILAGFFVLVWGRSLARRGDWLIALSLALAFIGLSLGGVALWQADFKPLLWQRGWIWPRAETGAITVGVMVDAVGFVISAIANLVSLVFLSQWRLFIGEPRGERIHAGVGLSFGGICMAWIALTPWLALAGLSLAVFGGFVALGSRWSADSDAAAATRFAWERFSGVFLIILGACGLAGSRIAHGWGESAFPNGEVAAFSDGKNLADFIGAFLLVLGSFIQFQPFPFLGWLNSAPEAIVSVRSIMAQLSPAVAAFALLFRLEPELKAIGIFPGFGWVQLASAFLALGLGLLQSKWKMSFGAWISAGLSISSAILAFCGQTCGLSLLMGIYLGGAAVACAASSMENSEPHSATTLLRGKWSKVIAFFGMCAATGMIGFVPVSDLIHWMGQSWEQPIQAPLSLLILFLFTLLGWELVWKLARSVRSVQLGWVSVLSPIFLVLLSLGVVWNGKVTGGALPGEIDEVLPSLSRHFFAGARPNAFDDTLFTVVSSVYWGALFLALGAAFWLASKKPWQPQKTRMADLKELIATGYGVDKVSKLALDGVVALGAGLEALIDRKFWYQWVPEGIAFVIGRLSALVAAADAVMSEKLAIGLRNGIELPAKALQLLQNGDVQWYLLFAVGSGVAIFFHFLKF